MIEQKGQNPNKSPKQDSSYFNWMIFAEMAMDFAVVIAVPLLFFIFLSQILNLVGLHGASEWAKHKRETSNLYNVSGLFLAIFFSFYVIIKKIRKINDIINSK